VTTTDDVRAALEQLRTAAEPLLRALQAATAVVASADAVIPDAKRLACIKCGSREISTRWDADYYDCLYAQQSRHDWPFHGGEHLHHGCRECGWTWAAVLRIPPADPQPRIPA
jgi:hypothetical protein